MKALSPHVQLECTTCHAVPEGHKVTPRAIQASIPPNRDFCGKCHATDSQIKGTPKIDVATHGEKYLCWQCHYPHMPEVN
jgi:ribosomal protein S27AE